MLLALCPCTGTRKRVASARASALRPSEGKKERKKESQRLRWDITFPCTHPYMCCETWREDQFYLQYVPELLVEQLSSNVINSAAVLKPKTSRVFDNSAWSAGCRGICADLHSFGHESFVLLVASCRHWRSKGTCLRLRTVLVPSRGASHSICCTSKLQRGLQSQEGFS